MAVLVSLPAPTKEIADENKHDNTWKSWKMGLQSLNYKKRSSQDHSNLVPTFDEGIDYKPTHRFRHLPSKKRMK
eukprot:scaffold226_cov98-Cylindrotheca_fusiformis.AAC.2